MATDEKRMTTPQKKMMVTWRPAGMVLSRSGKTVRETRERGRVMKRRTVREEPQEETEEPSSSSSSLSSSSSSVADS